MLSLKTLPFLPRHPLPILPKSRISLSPKLSLSTTPMDPTATAAATTTTTVEHVVLFKVRDAADPTAMITSLRSLSSLNLSTYLTAVPILRSSSPLPFTHLLHSRYLSKPDLAAYANHPDHLSAVRSHVLPTCDDILAVDFLSPFLLPPPPSGSAIRITLAKPNPNTSPSQLLDAVADATRSGAEGVLQISYGENFSPARAKGYEVGVIAVFPGVEEMEKAMEGAETAKEKVRPLLESVIVVDYVVPEPTEATASL